MIYGKVIGIIITLCGITYCLTNIIILVKCTLSQRVPAAIICYSGRGNIRIFTYCVSVAPGVALRLEREVLPLMNLLPFYSINNYVGRNVMVPFDPKKQKLLPHEPILIVKLVLSLVVTALGIVMLIVLNKVQH